MGKTASIYPPINSSIFIHFPYFCYEFNFVFVSLVSSVCYFDFKNSIEIADYIDVVREYSNEYGSCTVRSSPIIRFTQNEMRKLL